MKISQLDTRQVNHAIGIVREAIFLRIDAVLSFLNPTATDDPSASPADKLSYFTQEGVNAAALNTIGQLDGLAELHAWIVHKETIMAVLDRYGPDATMQHVVRALQNGLNQVTQHLDHQVGPSRGFDVYAILLARYIGRAIIICESVEFAMGSLVPLMDKIAPALGLPLDVFKERLRSGDKTVKEALAKGLLDETVEKIKANGLSPQAVIPAGLAKLYGEDPREYSGVPEDVSDIAKKLGLDPASLRILDEKPAQPPRSIPRYAEPAD